MNSTDRNVPSPPLLTLEDIIHIKHELDQALREQAELPVKIANLKLRFEAAMQFAPPGFNPDEVNIQQPELAGIPSREDVIASLNSAPTGRITWSGEISRLLKKSNSGKSYPELLNELNKGELGKKPSKGDKGFYNAIARLIAKKEAVKSGGLLYATEVFNKLKASGTPLPEINEELKRGSSSTVIFEILDKNKKGLTANELKAALAGRNDLPKSMAGHGQYIYTVLGTLVGRGLVKKENNKYVVATK